MSNYRFFIRRVAGCDNATADAAEYAQSGLVWTTPTNTAAGRWGPDILKRVNTCSLVRVDLQGTILNTDTVRVIASNGQTRKAVLASLDSSGWLFMDPTDTLGIQCAGATSVGTLVNDLSDEALQKWVETEQASLIPDLPLQQTEIDVIATQAIPAYLGTLIVNIDAAADADLSLPALVDTEPGKTVITFIRTGGAGEPRIIPDDDLDEVNGLAGIIANQYFGPEDVGPIKTVEEAHG